MRLFKYQDAPPFFGRHPNNKEMYTGVSKSGILPHLIANRESVTISEFRDSRHPSITLIPRDRNILVVDDMDDPVGLDQHMFPFSSYDFFIDTENGGIFGEMDLSSSAYRRLGGISQLGYLVPPYQQRYPEVSISTVQPFFPHTRWIHSLIAAAIMEVVLARNGFSLIERNPIVLTMGYHDIAMPAGGDSIKRIDPKQLDEESNFLLALEKLGLLDRWKEEYGFIPEQAEQWVYNQSCFGLLLDVIDRMSYVSLDSYYHGMHIEGPLRSHCVQHPLFMDVWQDIRFTSERRLFAFTDANRLYDFLLARAMEHHELLLNPYCRAMDFFLTNLVTPLYQRGAITKDNLLSWNTQELQYNLAKHYPGQNVTPYWYDPDEYQWKKCASQAELDWLVRDLSKHVYFTEHLEGFKTGLDWPVFADQRCSKIVPLFTLLPKRKIHRLNDLVKACSGYFAYWYTRP